MTQISRSLKGIKNSILSPFGYKPYLDEWEMKGVTMETEDEDYDFLKPLKEFQEYLENYDTYKMKDEIDEIEEWLNSL